QCVFIFFFFFFYDPATTAISTLSLHDALPILHGHRIARVQLQREEAFLGRFAAGAFVDDIDRWHVVDEMLEMIPLGDDHVIAQGDRKSTRLNSSHVAISYAVFCLKKKKIIHDK